LRLMGQKLCCGRTGPQDMVLHGLSLVHKFDDNS
jgi:hypothetical protein